MNAKHRRIYLTCHRENFIVNPENLAIISHVDVSEASSIAEERVVEKKTKGAWLLHHSRKIIQATTSQDSDSISFAGKCGMLLSAISAESQSQIPAKRLDALAKANHISPKTEAPAIVSELERQRLILAGSGGIEVLGLTGQAILEHIDNF